MSDTKETGERGSSGRRPLTLKRTVESGTVRQNLSGGRQKGVVVETRKKRTIQPKGVKPTVKKVEKKVIKETAETPPADAAVSSLTDQEREARQKALASAQVRQEEDRIRAEETAARRKEEDERRAREREEEERRRAEEEARLTAEKEVKQREQEANDRREEQERLDAERAAAMEAARGDEEESRSNTLGGRIKKKTPAQKPQQKTKGEPRRRQGKLTIAQALDDSERTRSLASMRRKREREKRQAQGIAPDQVVREVVVPEAISIKDLAERMAIRSVDVIKVLMKQGQMVTVNDVIDADTAQLIAEEYGHTVKRVADSDVEEAIQGPEDSEDQLAPRAPVVTVMGHVDHGKTSLLDAIREADVAEGEAGGITQHIGAYQVSTAAGQKITFLDTPGHAAFTAMRARGAQATDIVVLVVAGDDSVMPQTVEAINHAKAAEVPIIVAINKMDKPDANALKVKQDLLQHELISEEMGGDIQAIEVSAHTKAGLDELEEAIMLQAEILELKANPDRRAQGTVVEAELDKGRGAVATVLVQKGTLKKGDIFVAGQEWGRVRALINDRGETVDEAGPAVPVEVLGLNGVPLAGDDLTVVEHESQAREVAEYRQRKLKDAKVAASSAKRGSLEQMLAQLKETDAKELPILVKGDVQGSVEAIIGALDNLGTDEVRAKAIHTAVGGITESDIILAQASQAPIIAFNVRASTPARDLAAREGVEIRYYSVIYDVVDDIKAAMSGLLEPTLRENFLGNAEILEVFNITKVGRVAGCRVSEGNVRRGAKVRLIRDNVVIHEGTLSTLKRFKDEVKEVVVGQECGMAFENYQDIQAGDVIECFEVEEISRTL